MKSLVLILILSIILTITATEIYLKKVGLGDPVRYDSNYVYGYSLKENQKKIRINNATVTVNDFGLRTIVNWKDNIKKKIIFLGDSITYGGSYIDDTKIFSELVCKDFIDYICGNAGVNAYSIINIVMRSKYDKRLEKADKYIFLVAPGDFYRDYADSNTAHFYLNKRNFILPAIMEAINFVGTKYDINKYISKKDDTNTNQNQKDLVDFSIQLLDKEINRLNNLNKDVYLFYTIEKNDKNSNKAMNRYVLDKLINLNLKNFISLQDTLNKDLYFYDNVHYAEQGHKKVAEKIISILNIRR